MAGPLAEQESEATRRSVTFRVTPLTRRAGRVQGEPHVGERQCMGEQHCGERPNEDVRAGPQAKQDCEAQR